MTWETTLTTCGRNRAKLKCSSTQLFPVCDAAKMHMNLEGFGLLKDASAISVTACTSLVEQSQIKVPCHCHVSAVFGCGAV